MFWPLNLLFSPQSPTAPQLPAASHARADGLVVRSDGWVSPLTGIGTSRDKMQDGYYTDELPLQYSELDALFYNNDLAERMVCAVVKDRFSRGFAVKIDDDEQKGQEALDSLKRLEIKREVSQLCTWSRQYGGALIVVGLNDGQPLDQPLDLRRVRSVDWLLTLDRRYAQASRWCTELGPNFGMPEAYTVSTSAGGASFSTTVHASRVVAMDGDSVDRQRRQKMGGWGQSVLQRPYDILRKFGLSFDSVALMLSDATQGVFKLEGLISAMASGSGDALFTRMQLLDLGRSTARSILLDADKEDFQKQATNFTGVPDILDRLMQRLSASARMPVSILMGRSAAGLNATGDLDLAAWHKEVESYGTERPKPALERLIYLALAPMHRGKEMDVDVCFPPLGEDSPSTRADVYGKMAAADNIYVMMGALAPEQVAIARFGSGQFSLESPHVDVDQLEADMLAARFAEPAEPQAEPADPAEEGAAE